MNRNLKVLGMALAVVFATSAVVAAAASAQGKFTSDGPVTLKATETTGGPDINGLTLFSHRVECPGSILTGHKYNVTPHGLIASGETTATLTPHYEQKNCKIVDLGAPMTVTMNGCDYVVHVGATAPAPNNTQYEVTFDIVCPVGKVIEWDVYSSSTEALKLCTIKVKAQTGLTGATAKNTAATGTTKNDLDIVGTLHSTHAEREGLCKGEGGLADTTNAAVVDIDVTVKGYNAAGEETGVTISD